ncbi:MAG: BrnT family toxin [Gammaproteobacteria bacterium]
MQFEWDPNKQRTNLRKHGVELADAVAVFRDPLSVRVEDSAHDEQRFASIGLDAFGRVLVVVYTYCGQDTIRIISARKADASERKQYIG